MRREVQDNRDSGFGAARRPGMTLHNRSATRRARRGPCSRNALMTCPEIIRRLRTSPRFCG